MVVLGIDPGTANTGYGVVARRGARLVALDGGTIETAARLEAGERLRTGHRGRFAPAELVEALTGAGHAALGWPAGGRIALGVPADLVAVDTSSPRTAGVRPEEVPLAATAADVRTVVVDGRVVVSEGRHVLGDVGTLLREAIEPLWEDA